MSGKRLKNEHSFTCLNLTGMMVESIIGFNESHHKNGVDMIIMKFKEHNLHQRFFLDAGIGFWEEWSENDALNDYEDVEKIDLAKKYSLKNKRVSNIECHGSIGILSSFVFEFENTKLKLHYINKQDSESDTEIILS